MVTKGFMTFRLGPAGLESQTTTIDDMVKDFTNSTDQNFIDVLVEGIVKNKLTVQEYSIMSGIEFLDAVNSTCIIDDDGSLSEVLVDGFISNLGLSHKNFSQGDFLVTYDVWRSICSNHDVVVNWANK